MSHCRLLYPRVSQWVWPAGSHWIPLLPISSHYLCKYMVFLCLPNHVILKLLIYPIISCPHSVKECSTTKSDFMLCLVSTMTPSRLFWDSYSEARCNRQRMGTWAAHMAAVTKLCWDRHSPRHTTAPMLIRTSPYLSLNYLLWSISGCKKSATDFISVLFIFTSKKKFLQYIFLPNLNGIKKVYN
jgi:hypothetical protein